MTVRGTAHDIPQKVTRMPSICGIYLFAEGSRCPFTPVGPPCPDSSPTLLFNHRRIESVTQPSLKMYLLIANLEKTSARTVVSSEELGIGKSGAGPLEQCARCAI